MGAFSEDCGFSPVGCGDSHFDDSSSSSSIGRNSDQSVGEDSSHDFDDSEVQSSYKGPLDTMDALEEVLPIKRGLSKFYNGKSKSFTSLADASSASSIKDFAKPENPYTRKPKNLLACSNFWDKNGNYPPKDDATGISKRLAENSNRNTSTLWSTISNSKEYSHTVSSPTSCLPPLHPQLQGKSSLNIGSCTPVPQKNSHCRSFSLSDLQYAAATATTHNN